MGRRNLVLLVLFGALLALYLLDEDRFAGTAVSPTISLELFPDFAPVAADRIVIATPDRTTELRRDGEEWRMATSGDAPVATSKVDELLDRVAKLKKGTVASRNPESFERLRVDGSNREVRIYSAGEEPLIHLYVGGLGSGRSRTFLRKEGMEEVLAVLETDLNSLFNPAPFAWFEKLQVVEFDPKLLARMRFTTPEGPVVLARDEAGDWQAEEPAELEIEQNVAAQLARSLSQLRYFDVAAADAGLPFGFDEPVLELTLELADDISHRLTAGGTNPEGTQRYVRLDEEEFVYLVPVRGFDPPVLRTVRRWVGGEGSASARPQGRTFTGPDMGAEMIRALIGSDVVIEGVADEDSVGGDGSLVGASGDVEQVPVPFRIERVLKGEDALPQGVGVGEQPIVVELPAKRQLPDLRAERGPHLLLLVEGEDPGRFRLQGDPVGTLIQPPPATRAAIDQVLQQMRSAPKPPDDR